MVFLLLCQQQTQAKSRWVASQRNGYKPPSFLPSTCRKCTFDMFNFLASQHRVLPEGATCDEEEDEVQLRSTRYGCWRGLEVS